MYIVYNTLNKYYIYTYIYILVDPLTGVETAP